MFISSSSGFVGLTEAKPRAGRLDVPRYWRRPEEIARYGSLAGVSFREKSSRM
jgi:hypothetical protein